MLMYAAYAGRLNKYDNPEHRGPQSQVPVPTIPILDVLTATVSLYFLKMSLLVPLGQYPLVTMAGFPPYPA